ncbi:MAG: hypothetical protein IKR76_09425 [Ruminococcus sp.]|nr:hypothetical protein [Ruminococcus sp.]
MPPLIDEADFRQHLLSNAKDYFADAPFCEYVFVTDGSSLEFESFKDEPPDPARTQELSDEIDSFLKNDPYASLGYDSLQKMLQERARDKSGLYCKQGKGFALAFSNMKDFSDYDCYIGLVMYDANSTLIAPVKETTSEEANVLINEIDGIFERYIYILLGSVGGVLVVFIVISAVLSKVLADPVVSEHDMLVQVDEMKTAFLSDASHELNYVWLCSERRA